MTGENVVAHAGVARATADAHSPGIGVELPPPEPGVKRGATLDHRGLRICPRRIVNNRQREGGQQGPRGMRRSHGQRRNAGTPRD